MDACSVTSVMSDSCDPMDCSLLGSSVHGILQARILEQVAMLSFRGSSWPRDRTHLLQLLHCRWTLYPLSHLGSPRTQRFKTWNAGVGTGVRAEAGLDGFTVLRFCEIKNAYGAVFWSQGQMRRPSNPSLLPGPAPQQMLLLASWWEHQNRR